MKLTDWKVTSCYSFLLGDKPEWEAQLNCYAWLYRQNGFQVTKLQIVAILRDWMASRAEKEPDYPQCAVMVVEIPLWEPTVIQEYIEHRVRIHQEAEDVPDDWLNPCSPQERWEKPTTWAVMKKGNKRATRVYEEEPMARAHMLQQSALNAKDFEIVERPGESVRCERYCKAAPFCSQKKEMDNAKNGSNS